MEIKITPKLLAELKEKAKKATPGPWHEYYDPRDNMIEGPTCEWVMGLDERYRCPLIFNELLPDDIAETIAEHCEARVDISEEDLSYMAAANPAIILALIDRIEKDRELIEFLRISNEIDEIMGRANYAFLDRLQAILEIKPDTQNLTRKIDDIYADILNAVKSLKHK